MPKKDLQEKNEAFISGRICNMQDFRGTVRCTTMTKIKQLPHLLNAVRHTDLSTSPCKEKMSCN